jgi:hypothetical protein
MGGSMNCVSPAPMGGPGSFACYPTQQMGQGGMGMGGMMGGMMGGWHPHMGYYGPHHPYGYGPGYRDESGYGRDYSPNWYYQDRQQYRRGSGSYGQGEYDRNRGYDGQSQYDNDWRSGPAYDRRSSGDYSNRSYEGSQQ